MVANVDRPLSGVFTLDLSTGLAGSFAAKILAEYGANVVKVEDLGGGPERSIGPFPPAFEDLEHSGMFLYLNTNKRGVAIDSTGSEGQRALCDLVEKAEIVVLGDRALDVSALIDGCAPLGNASADGRVVTAVTGYGLTGPYASREAEEINLFGFGGPMLATGVPEREPMMYPEHSAMLYAGMAAALATMISYFGKLMSGRGTLIDFSIAETMLGSWDRRAYSLQAYQYWGGVNPAARMTSHAMGFGTYRCKDGNVSIAAQGGRLPNLLAMIEREDLGEDPRFKGFAATFDPKNFEAFNEILDGWLIEHTREEVFVLGQKHGVLVAPVLTSGETLSDTHLEQREFWLRMEDRDIEYTLPGRPVRMHGDDPEPTRAAPRLGEHTLEVLRDELGYAESSIDSLRRAGVL